MKEFFLYLFPDARYGCKKHGGQIHLMTLIKRLTINIVN